MKIFNTIVFGCSGLIGVTLAGLLKNNKTLFVSRTKPKNIISNNKLIYFYNSKENSKKIFVNYYNNLIDEKTRKVQHL